MADSPPFVEYFTGARAAEPAHRLLLVTYSFPPDRLVGALRWEQFAISLAQLGWGVDVVTLDPAYLPSPDPTRLDALPPQLRVFGVPHPPLPVQRAQASLLAARRGLLARLRGRRGHASAGAAPAEVTTPTPPTRELAAAGGGEYGARAGGVRGVLSGAWNAYLDAVDDAWFRRWAERVADVSVGLVRDRGHAVVVTSGPPHMAHVAGRMVAERTGVPLVVDFRDPWSLGSHMSEAERRRSWKLRLGAAHERRVIEQARLVILNTEPARRAMAVAHPAAAGRMLTVMNGADGEPWPPAPRGTRFVIAYAGSIYIDRDPTPLFRALRRVATELGLTPADIGVEMVGNVQEFCGRPVREIAAREGVAEFVTLGPGVTRGEALAFQARAQMLVLLPQQSATQTPAKVFEYVNFAAWLLAFAPPDSATEQLLRDTDAHLVGLADADGAAAAIRQRYLEWRGGGVPRAVNADGRFSRATQTARLADALETVRGGTPAAPTLVAAR